MRNKVFIIMTILVFSAMLALGLMTRGSHNDIVHQEDFWEHVVVAELPDILSDICFDNFPDVLDNAEYVLQVKATGDLQFYGYAGSQEVEIVKIFKGEGILTTQRICLTTESWRLDTEKDSVAMGRGFVNVMESGKEYLVFGQALSGVYWKDVPVLTLFDAGMLVPVFGYQDGESVTADHDEYSTYVEYNKIRENEFFGESSDTIDLWNDIKKQVFEKYAS